MNVYVADGSVFTSAGGFNPTVTIMALALRTARHLSGADIESILLAARRRALANQNTEVQRADLEQAVAEFLPSTQGLEKEKQELAAVLGERINEGLAGKVSGKSIGEILDEELGEGRR